MTFQRHLTLDPSCTCGYHHETVQHFLLECSNYTNIRLNTILQVKEENRCINTLLFGSPELTIAENEIVFDYVQTFIKLSARFD
jgi:hypothetical protein